MTRIVPLLLLLISSSVFAKTYTSGDYSLEITSINPWCTGRIDAVLTGPPLNLTKESVADAQDAVDHIIHQMQADCNRGIAIYYSTSGGTRLRGGMLSIANGKLSDYRRFHIEEFRAVKRDAQKLIDDFLSSSSRAEHPLKDYGYAKSQLIGEGDGASLYLGQHKSSSKSTKFVVVHDPKSGPMIDTLPPDDQGGIIPAPSHYDLLERLFSKVTIAEGEHLISHYIKGYHRPDEDRLIVLGPARVETPLIVTRFNITYRRGSARASKPDSYSYTRLTNSRSAWNYSYPSTGSKPLDVNLGVALTLAQATEYFGPSSDSPKPDVPVEIDPEGPSKEYIASQRQLRNTALERGLIYKNDNFWAQFKGSAVRSMFEAYAGVVGVGRDAENAALMRYLYRMSEDCRKYIENPRPFKYVEVTTTTNGWGNTHQSTDTIWNLTVPAKFIPILDRNFGSENASVAETFNSIASVLKPGGISQARRDFSRLAAEINTTSSDVDRIFDLGPCSDPHQQQLEEMIYHYQLNLDPSEHSQLKFSNVQHLSDSVYEPGQAQDMKTACLANRDFIKDTRIMGYCECTTDVVARNAPDRVQLYTKWYKQLQADYENARVALARGQMDHPGIAIFGNMQSSCTAYIN